MPHSSQLYRDEWETTNLGLSAPLPIPLPNTLLVISEGNPRLSLPVLLHSTHPQIRVPHPAQPCRNEWETTKPNPSVIPTNRATFNPMELNPYASHLGQQDARAVLASTPGLIHQAVCQLTPEQIEAPIAPGKWSPRQIVAHLADCEMVFSFRLRQTLAEPDHIVQPFDQDKWSQRYAVYPLPEALELYRAARAWNLKLIGGLHSADFARPVTHPERGTMTFMTILETMAGHDLNHLVQLQKLIPA